MIFQTPDEDPNQRGHAGSIIQDPTLPPVRLLFPGHVHQLSPPSSCARYRAQQGPLASCGLQARQGGWLPTLFQRSISDRRGLERIGIEGVLRILLGESSSF